MQTGENALKLHYSRSVAVIVFFLLASQTSFKRPTYAFPKKWNCTMFSLSQVFAEPTMANDTICGPNSLYLFLNLNGIKVDRSIVQKYKPTHPDGMSLEELSNASQLLGLKGSIRKISLQELSHQFDSPFIAYLVTPEKKHYVVVIGMTPKHVTFIDGTTGEQITTTNKWLSNSWSGFVLVRQSTYSWLWTYLPTLIFGLMLVSRIFKHSEKHKMYN